MGWQAMHIPLLPLTAAGVTAYYTLTRLPHTPLGYTIDAFATCAAFLVFRPKTLKNIAHSFGGFVKCAYSEVIRSPPLLLLVGMFIKAEFCLPISWDMREMPWLAWPLGK